jgi:ABC-type cobalamin/Fe3+-siderophores transport system ATPase subunit
VFRAEGRHVTDTDMIPPRENADDREERRARNSVMARVERDVLAMLDEMISQFQSEPLGDEPREYLDALRVLLKSQATAYMSYLRSHRDGLSSTTSPMYAGAFGPAGPVPTTLRGLIEARTMATAQAARLAAYVSDRRTLLIFGDRATGKSTLLNALLELLPLDERFVSIEHSDHLPALKDRSFCVQLSVNDDTDIEAVFLKAMKMQPSRIVVGELHADEILYFLSALRTHRECGGFCTVRADSVHRAVAKLLRQMELHVTATEARQIVGETRPVLVHMRSDERGEPRLAAIWAVEKLDAAGEILLREEPVGQILEA